MLGFVTLGLQANNLVAVDGALSDYANALLEWDLLLGLLASAAIGPLARNGRRNYWLLAFTPFSTFALPAICVALMRLGGLRQRRDDVRATLVMMVGGTLQAWLAQGAGTFNPLLLFGGLLTAMVGYAFLVWGRSRARAGATLDSLRVHAAAVERERLELARSRAVAEERARSDERAAIARDMHDSLSHHLSLIAMHAGALAYRDDMSPEQMRATAQTLRDTAGSANAELRGVLTALRSPDIDTAPLPRAMDVLTVVDDARARGHDVALRFEGMNEDDLTRLSGTAGAALHRIITELVVNAGKHAPGAPLTLVFRSDADTLIVHSTNSTTSDSTALSTGLGLVGVRERVRLLGDTMTTPHTPGDFTVEVRIPWRS